MVLVVFHCIDRGVSDNDCGLGLCQVCVCFFYNLLSFFLSLSPSFALSKQLANFPTIYFVFKDSSGQEVHVGMLPSAYLEHQVYMYGEHVWRVREWYGYRCVVFVIDLRHRSHSQRRFSAS